MPSRRSFLVRSMAAVPLLAAAESQDSRPITQASVPGDPAAPHDQPGTVPATPAFTPPLNYHAEAVALAVEPFSLTQVRLLESAFLDAQQANRSLLHRYSADRLLHTFRLNAGLPSNAQPLGGWERPDCELRGHFTGHFLSACALMHASTGDPDVKAKADYMVAELAKCQQHLQGGYLSAFPTELFDRLRERKRVWAPFYTYHKILAGMLEVHQHCQNAQALAVARGMADWVDHWTAALSPEQMQMVLDEEFGGMNEALYNLAVLSETPHYAEVGDRFTKVRFMNPLAARQDRLRGLHANTHIPQVIGAARRYEISSDTNFHTVATTFWQDVAHTRSYASGGTSNNEGWLTEPNHQWQELNLGSATNECCCVYNMLKLTRHLYTWSPDPRYFDYYERILYNHRLGTIDPTNGHTQYYLGAVPGSWRTFATEDDSFWCCNGTGVEEYSKLGDSIYFHNGDALYVNLFIPSELNWQERGLQIRQTNRFPSEAATHLEVKANTPTRLTIFIRVPSWVEGWPAVSINGKASDASAAPGSYLAISRVWRSGDRIEIKLPMSLHYEPMPDQPTVKAALFGPVLLAASLDEAPVPHDLVVGPMGPDFKKHSSAPLPNLGALRAGEQALSFSDGKHNLRPFASFGPGQPYSYYWQTEA